MKAFCYSVFGKVKVLANVKSCINVTKTYSVSYFTSDFAKNAFHSYDCLKVKIYDLCMEFYYQNTAAVTTSIQVPYVMWYTCSRTDGIELLLYL